MKSKPETKDPKRAEELKLKRQQSTLKIKNMKFNESEAK
jgi:hypothetical protein